VLLDYVATLCHCCGSSALSLMLRLPTRSAADPTCRVPWSGPCGHGRVLGRARCARSVVLRVPADRAHATLGPGLHGHTSTSSRAAHGTQRRRPDLSGAMPTLLAWSVVAPSLSRSVGVCAAGELGRHACNGGSDGVRIGCPIPLASTGHLAVSRMCIVSKLGVGDRRIWIASPSSRVLTLRHRSPRVPLRFTRGLIPSPAARVSRHRLVSCPSVAHAKRSRPTKWASPAARVRPRPCLDRPSIIRARHSRGTHALRFGALGRSSANP
jgi:hypothetical protein